MTPLRDLSGDEAADALGIDRKEFGPPEPLPTYLRTLADGVRLLIMSSNPANR